MKRCLFKLVGFVTLGLAINLAVTFGCVLLSKNYESITFQTVKYHDGDSLKIKSLKSFGSEYLHSSVRDRRSNRPPKEEFWLSSLDWSQLRRRGFDELDHIWITRSEGAHGWPLYCLRWSRDYRNIKGGFQIGHPSMFQHSYKTRNSSSHASFQTYTVVPFLPIWKGLVLNTLLYAAILWLLILGQWTLHRMLRRKRGCCIKCGYDLRGDTSQGCPECGWGREAEA